MSTPEPKPDRDPVPRKTFRGRVHDILEFGVEHDRAGKALNGFLVILIFLNVIAFSAETVPALGERYAPYFAAFNLFSVIIFTIEYGLRIWSCVEIPVLQQHRSTRARIHFALQPMLLIDLLAILPFYLSFVVAIDLRILRVFRLFRFLKLARYSPAIQSLFRVLVNERRALLGALVVMMALILFASTGIYFLERHIQPDVFGSIPSAAWWALATLTTVGYGDVVPVTPFGRLFGALIMIFGLGMFAMPVAIVAAGFSQETGRREFVVTWSMVARLPLFADLNARSVGEIMALLYSRSYHAGADIVRRGDDPQSVFFITSGEVMVDADEGQVMLGTGDFFGEMALLERRPRQHAVTAHTRCHLLVLDRHDFDRLCSRMPGIYGRIRAVAAKRSMPGDGDASP